MRVRLLEIYEPYFHTRRRRRRCFCCCLEFFMEASRQMMARKFKHVLEVYGKKRTTGYVVLISTNSFL
jgi:hypothetical protein